MVRQERTRLGESLRRPDLIEPLARLKAEQPPAPYQPPVPQYHDGLNVAPGQEIEQNHQEGYHIEDADAAPALVVPRL